MDRPPHDYAVAASMGYSQQLSQHHTPNMPQKFGFHGQHQQFPSAAHGPPFLPPHPSLPQYPFPGQQPPLHPPPHPHLLHLQQQQHPPPPFPPHIPPHLSPSPFSGSFDSAPPPAPPPPDPDLHRCIDKLVEFSARNGPEFEAMIREKHQDSPNYSFLFGGEGHGYYRYKLWLSTHPPGSFNAPFPSPVPMMHAPSNPMMTPGAPLIGAPGSSGPVMVPPDMHRPPFPPYFDPQHGHSIPYIGQGRPDYDPSSMAFRGLSGPLPSDVAMELNNVLGSLTGTKESIKGAKMWFMQRAAFAPALADALRDRIFAIDHAERQLHIIYLANDILFDSLQRRSNPHDLDNEALAFRPVLGPMLARVFHNPQSKEENQSRLQKILQFWASKEVYDHDTIRSLEGEMTRTLPSNAFPGLPKELPGAAADSSAGGSAHQAASSNFPHWQQDHLGHSMKQETSDNHGQPSSTMLQGQQVVNSVVATASFPRPLSVSAAAMLTNQQGAPSSLPPPPANITEKLPPYPLFPPGLIPGMVRKQQIGSGVPYSPMSPLDIPTIIPPPDIPESEILDRVSKFFKDIGEVNPFEGPMKSSSGLRYEDEYEREAPIRKGGACIPPPPNLRVDTETGADADGSGVDDESGRTGLGAAADPDEVSQYDDVYSSYRKQRSTTYHSSMSSIAGGK